VLLFEFEMVKGLGLGMGYGKWEMGMLGSGYSSWILHGLVGWVGIG